ncbi:hypothetical protein BH10ACT9_BH10ACT9_01770 [soil metagenome]
MANTTPEHQETIGTPSARGSFSAGDSALFGDPSLALYGGYGAITAGTPPANDGM